MNIGSPYEKGTLKNRLRELATWPARCLRALSIISDGLIALMTLCGNEHRHSTNNNGPHYCFASLITIYPLTRKILFLKRSGIDASGIILHLVKKIAHHLIIALMFLGVSALLIFILYLLLSNNHFLLSRALNIP